MKQPNYAEMDSSEIMERFRVPDVPGVCALGFIAMQRIACEIHSFGGPHVNAALYALWDMRAELLQQRLEAVK